MHGVQVDGASAAPQRLVLAQDGRRQRFEISIGVSGTENRANRAGCAEQSGNGWEDDLATFPQRRASPVPRAGFVQKRMWNLRARARASKVRARVGCARGAHKPRNVGARFQSAALLHRRGGQNEVRAETRERPDVKTAATSAVRSVTYAAGHGLAATTG
jgi:hypothetical protein